MPDKLSILVNTAQSRIDKERVTITVAGKDFDDANSSNIWIDPVTDTTMLLPVCLDSTWQTSSTGDNARLTLSDFGLGSSSLWKTKSNTGAGMVRLFAPSGMGGTNAATTATYGINRGWYVSFYSFNTGNANDQVAFQWGISNTQDSTAGVGLQFFAADGNCEVYKNGTKLKKYSFGGSIVNAFAEFIILPMRRRELLVFCITTGTGFIHVFDDIAETATSPSILPDEKMWFYVPGTNRPADVEIAPLRFKASGYARSKTYSFGRVPQTGQTLGTYSNGSPATTITNSRVFADPGSWTATSEAISAVAIETTGGSAYTPNGIISQVKVKVSMTAASGNGYTPFLRGVSTSYTASFVDTDDSEEFDITSSILSASLSVPDDPGGVEMHVVLKDPEDVQTDVAGLLAHENIPCKVKLGALVILDGIINPVKFTDGLHGEVMTGDLVIRDRMAAMQSYILRDRIPLDGLLLSDMTDPDCVGGLLETVGITDYDIDNIAYNIPSIPGESCSEFSHMMESGSTPFSELSSLVTEIAFGFLWGIKPTATTPKAFFNDPDTYTQRTITLYRSPEDAIAGGVSSTDAPYRCYDNYHREPLPIAGNEVRVMGLDPRKQEPIVRWQEDAASKNPATAPSLRPTNWCGEPRVVGFQSPRLQTAEACEKLIETAAPKIFARNYVTSADSMFLIDSADGVPLWRGDQIVYDGRETVTITAFTAEFICERDDLTFRSANYVGGASFGLGGSSLSEIRNNFGAFFGGGSVRRDFSNLFGNSLVASSVEVP
jgi:hypothetical protein